MSVYIIGVLGLFDNIVVALLGVPVFAFFLGGFVLFAVFGLFLLLTSAAGGRNIKR